MSPTPKHYTIEQLETLQQAVRTENNPMPLLLKINNDLPHITDTSVVAKLNYIVALGYAHIGAYHKLAPYVKAAEKLARQQRDRELLLKVKALLIIDGVRGYIKVDIKTEAQELIRSTEPNEHLHLIGLYELSRYYYQERNFAEALKRAYELLDKSIACGHTSLEQTAYQLLGWIHADVNELHLSQYYYERTYEKSLQQEAPHHVLQALGDLALGAGRLGNLDEAIKLFREILRRAKSDGINRNEIVPTTYLNLSNSYLLKGNTQRAEQYFAMCVETTDPDSTRNWYRIHVHNAELRIAKSEYLTAIDCLKEALQVGNLHNLCFYHDHIWKLLSLTYEKLGMTMQALDAYKEYSRLKEQEHKAILSAQKVLNKSREEFRKVQESVKHAHDPITYLQETVSTQELAIATLATKLKLNEKLLHDFWYDLWKESPHLSSHFAGLLKSSKLNEASKHHFSQPIEQRKLANRFTQALATHHPKLTPTELQVLVCVRLGHTTFETAAIMKSSDRTVEHHRRNARRKMALPRSTSLVTYLASIDPD